LVLALAENLLRADLRVAQPRVNVAEARMGLPLAHRFAFVNDGPQAVEITDIVPSCGCMTPRFEQRIYRPGETGSVLLEVHTLSQPPGPHTWNARLKYRNGSALQQIVLQFSAQLVAEITVQPAALTIFADCAVEHDISVTDKRPHPLAIRAVRSSSDRLTARLTKEGRDPLGRRTWTIHIALANDFPTGRHEETVTICTGDTEYSDLRVPITIIKNARLRLAALPNQVSLTADPGAPLPAQLVRLRDRDNQEVIIDRIDTDSFAITCRWAPGPDTMATLKIMVDRQLVKNGTLQSAVHVHVSKPVQETVTIPVLVSGN
jgi:hypothetical protein